jgi:hypothetical protein
MEEEQHPRRKAMQVVEKTTLKVTKTIFIFVFFVMIIVTVIYSIYTFLSSKNLASFLEGILTLGIGGFWAFFLGYFGWRMGQTIEIYFHNLRKNR